MKSKEKNLILGFYKKSKKKNFCKATFFYFPFFSVSPNLANIRVDFAHNFEFLKFFVLFGKYVIYCKKNQVFFFHSLYHRAQKKFCL